MTYLNVACNFLNFILIFRRESIVFRTSEGSPTIKKLVSLFLKQRIYKKKYAIVQSAINLFRKIDLLIIIFKNMS